MFTLDLARLHVRELRRDAEGASDPKSNVGRQRAIRLAR